MIKRFVFWLTHNASSSHHRLMARYLKRQGWVCFYLEEEHRSCHHVGCYLEIYQHGEKGTNLK